MRSQNYSLLTSICISCVSALVLAIPTVLAQGSRDDSQNMPVKGQSNHNLFKNGELATKPSDTGQVLWPPVDVDAAVPAVAPEVACPLQEILGGVRQRVEDLVANLERFSATETVDSAEVAKSGRLKNSSVHSFNYVAAVSQHAGGDLQFDESRTAAGGSTTDPSPIKTVGLALGAALFHPSHFDDVDITCEGLGQWHGAPAWQLHFQERSERPSRFQAVFADGKWSDVRLKGRAWIGVEGDQIEQVDFDLSEPIPRIRLVAEHMSVEYCAVDFATRNTELWLPKSVDLYIDVGGHRYVNRHRLSNYLLFSVETKQDFQLPRELN